MSEMTIKEYAEDMVLRARECEGDLYQDKEFLKAESSFEGALLEKNRKFDDLAEALERNTDIAMNRLDAIRKQEIQIKNYEVVINTLAERIGILKDQYEMALLEIEELSSRRSN